MNHFDLRTHGKVLPSIAPQSIAAAADVDSAEIDTLGFTDAYFLITAGVTDTVLTTTFTEASAPGGSFSAALDDADTPVAISQAHSATDDGEVHKIHLRLDRRKRVLIMNLAAVGGAAGLCAATCILTGPTDTASGDKTDWLRV